MALVPIRTASVTGYGDCVCGCYELANLRDEDTGKGFCSACAKNHLDWNAGVGISIPRRQKLQPTFPTASVSWNYPPALMPPAVYAEDCMSERVPPGILSLHAPNSPVKSQIEGRIAKRGQPGLPM